jgi:hypothetical protein
MARIRICLPSQISFPTIVRNHILISFAIEVPLSNLQNSKKTTET